MKKTCCENDLSVYYQQSDNYDSKFAASPYSKPTTKAVLPKTRRIPSVKGSRLQPKQQRQLQRTSCSSVNSLEIHQKSQLVCTVPLQGINLPLPEKFCSSFLKAGVRCSICKAYFSLQDSVFCCLLSFINMKF